MGKYKAQEIPKVKEKLFEYLKNSQYCNNLCNVYYNLTHDWFEIYIWEYIKRTFWFDIKINWWRNDKWIDIIWTKIINWEEQKAYIQCKQRHWLTKYHVKENDLSQFLGKTYKLKNSKTFLYYITTSWYTPGAKKFAKENDIIIKDYKDIAKDIYEKLNIEQFKSIINYWCPEYKNIKIFEDDFWIIAKKKEKEYLEIKKETKIELNKLIKEKVNKRIIYKICLWIILLILILTMIDYFTVSFNQENINNIKDTSKNSNNISNISTNEIIITKNTKKNIQRKRVININQ